MPVEDRIRTSCEQKMDCHTPISGGIVSSVWGRQQNASLPWNEMLSLKGKIPRTREAFTPQQATESHLDEVHIQGEEGGKWAACVLIEIRVPGMLGFHSLTSLLGQDCSFSMICPLFHMFCAAPAMQASKHQLAGITCWGRANYATFSSSTHISGAWLGKSLDHSMIASLWSPSSRTALGTLLQMDRALSSMEAALNCTLGSDRNQRIREVYDSLSQNAMGADELALMVWS